MIRIVDEQQQQDQQQSSCKLFDCQFLLLMLLEACPFLYVRLYCRVCLLTILTCVPMLLLYPACNSGRSKGKATRVLYFLRFISPINTHVIYGLRSYGIFDRGPTWVGVHPGDTRRDPWSFCLSTPGSFCRFAGCSSCVRRGTGIQGAEDEKMYWYPLLKLTVCSENGWLEYVGILVSFLGWPIFRGELLVSGSVSHVTWFPGVSFRSPHKKRDQ